MKRSSFVSALLVFTLLFSFCVPSPGWAFLDFSTDALKSTGIIIGITAGVLLLVVLIVGTVRDVKGDKEDEDIWASLEDTKFDAFPTLLAGRDLLCSFRHGFTVEDPAPPAESLPANLLCAPGGDFVVQPSRFHVAGRGVLFLPGFTYDFGTVVHAPVYHDQPGYFSLLKEPNLAFLQETY